MNHGNRIPTITGTKIRLRPFALADAKAVQRLAGDPLVAATTATIPHPYPDGAAEAWISKHAEWFAKSYTVSWAIDSVKDDVLVGNVSLGITKEHLRAELGYWIGTPYWNQGYCSEAARLAAVFGFKTLGLNKITSRHMTDNPSSGRVMQKIGMKREGLLEQDHAKRGVFVDIAVYGLLKKDFTLD